MRDALRDRALRLDSGRFDARGRMRRRDGEIGAAGVGRAPAGCPHASDAPSTACRRIEPQAILDRIKVLASDEFEGRAPGTAGEDRTVDYLESEFKKLGLKPGNTDGTYIQKVPLVGITAAPTTPADLQQGRRRSRSSSGATRWSRGPSTSPIPPRSTTRTSSSPATASRRRSSTGTTSRASTSKERRSSCWSTTRPCPIRPIRTSSIRRRSAATR